jgi:hypothetical protein
MARTRHIEDFPATVPLAYYLLKHYGKARAAGLTTTISKQFAVAQTDRVRTNGPNIDLFSRRREQNSWWLGTAAHCNPATFDEKLRTALGVIPIGPRYDTAADSAVMQGLKKGRPDIYAWYQKARANHANIFRAAADFPARELSLPDLWLRCPEYPKRWFKINRGRDLFIKGWGKFDINEAARHSRTAYGVVADYSTTFYVTPTDIQAIGYGWPSRSYWFKQLMKPQNKWALRFVTRWLIWCRAHREILDELFSPPWTSPITTRCPLAKTIIKQRPNITAPQLFQLLQAERRTYYAQYTLNANYGQFPDLNFPSIETPLGSLVPIKTYNQLMTISSQLKNCAGSYARELANRQVLLLALLSDDGEPMALGEVRYNRAAKQWQWGQRLGPQNQQLAPAIKAVFDDYPLAAAGYFCETADPGVLLEP